MRHLGNSVFVVALVLALGVPWVPLRADDGAARLQIPLGHSDILLTPSFSANGELLVTTDNAGAAIIWNVAQRAQLMKFENSGFPVERAIALNDGSVLMMIDHRNVARFKASGEAPDLFGNGEGVLEFAFAEPLGLLTVAPRGVVRKWALNSREPSSPLPLGCEGVGSIDVTKDGRLIAFGCIIRDPVVDAKFTTELRVFETLKNTILWRQPLPPGTPSHNVRFSDLGHYIVLGESAPLAVELVRPEQRRVAEAATALRTLRLPTIEIERAGHTEEVSELMAVARGTDRLLIAGVSSMWDASSGQPADLGFSVKAVHGNDLAISPDFRLLARANSLESTVDVFNLEQSQWERSFESLVFPIVALEVSSDGKTLVSSSGASIRVWNLESGREMRRMLDGTFYRDIALYSNDRHLTVRAIGKSDARQRISRLDLLTGKVDQFPFTAEDTFFQFTGGGDAFIATSPGKEISLHESVTGATRGTPISNGPTLINRLSVSRDGNVIFASGTGTDPNSLMQDEGVIWNRRTGKRDSIHFDLGYRSWALSPDGSLLAGASRSGKLLVYRTSNPTNRVELEVGKPYIASVEPAIAFSATGGDLFVGFGNTGYLVSTVQFKVRREQFAQPTLITSATFLPNGAGVVTGGSDGAIRLWRQDAESIAGFVALDDALQWDAIYGSPYRPKGSVTPSLGASRWMAFDRDNHFDTDNFDETGSIHWILRSDPIHPLPLEAFMKVSFEPNLVHRALSGEKIPAPRVDLRNSYFRPKVVIRSVDYESRARDSVVVTIELTGENAAADPSTGVRDLRVFREHQMVGELFFKADADSDGRVPAGSPYCQQVPQSPNIVRCHGIQLRSRARSNMASGQNDAVLFSAYCFSANNIKSDTGLFLLPAPEELRQKRKPRAYVISVGVNANHNCALDLHYAANDAREISSVLEKELKRSSGYDVISLELISDYTGKCDHNTRTGDNAGIVVDEATRENIRAIFARLSGQPSSSSSDSGGKLSHLSRVGPDDAVILSFSSHGYRDDNGTFYLLPSDTKPVDSIDDGLDDVIASGISTKDLSDWVRDLDAGVLALIIDACHSEGSVASDDFKPGPMGSRGLGELAYGKGMSILVASQLDGLAREIATVKHGLLTYALINDGILEHQAPTTRNNGAVSLDDLFQYAEGDVPQLYRKYLSNRDVQYPKLFNFSPLANALTVTFVPQTVRLNISSFAEIKLGMPEPSVIKAMQECCEIEHNEIGQDVWIVKDKAGTDVGNLWFSKGQVQRIETSSFYKDMRSEDLLALIISDTSAHCRRTQGIPGVQGFAIDKAQVDQLSGRERVQGTITLSCGTHSIIVQALSGNSVSITLRDQKE